MRADAETRAAVNEVLNRMAAAMADKDIDAFMNLFADEANMLNIGIEEEEMSIGNTQLKEQMQKTFEEAESISLKYGWTSIRANGPVAWVASHVYYNIKKKGKEELNLSSRLTGVLEKTDNQWLWTQQHFSIARNIEEAIADALKKIIEEEKAKEAAEAADAAAQAEAEQAEVKAEKAEAKPAAAGQAEGKPGEAAKTAEKKKPKEEPAERDIDDIFYELG